MPITHTNRKGITYYLCRSVSKTGRPWYYFAREPRGEAVEQIPEGFKISEGVNGFVFLVSDLPSQILPEEVAAVEAAVRRHPRSADYQVKVKGNRIDIYERIGMGTNDLLALMGLEASPTGELPERVRTLQDRYARFEPVLRLTLADTERRIFHSERMHYGGGAAHFAPISPRGTADGLARKLIPKLGTDQFYELF